MNNYSKDTIKHIELIDLNLLIYFFQIKLGLSLTELYAPEVFQFSVEFLQNISKFYEQTKEKKIFNKKLLQFCRLLENAIDINFTYLKHFSNEVFELLES